MMFRITIGFALIAFYCSTSWAYILDTGPGPDSGFGGISLSGDGQFEQFLGVQFSLDVPDTIASVEGWMDAIPDVGATGTVAIYTDDNGLPGGQLFAAPFTTKGPGPNEVWEGALGLSWALDPGEYFATIEVRSGQTLEGAMPEGVPSAAQSYVVSNQFGQWQALPTDGGLGFRINTVPIPGAIWLFASCIAGVILTRR